MAKTKCEMHYLNELEKLDGKYNCTHSCKHDNRKETILVVKINDKYYVGNAQCSLKDTFSKKTGRALALRRAMIEYRKGNHAEPPEFLKFKEDKDEKNDEN